MLTDSTQPLSHMFSATPKGAPNPFTIPNLSQPRSPKIQVAEDLPDAAAARSESPLNPAVVHPPHRVEPRVPISLADSGYHGSQSQDTMPFDHFDKDVEMSDSPQRDLHISDPGLPLSSDPVAQRSPSPISVDDETFEAAEEYEKRQATAHATANVVPTPSSAVVQPSSPFASRTRLPMMSPRSPSPAKMSSAVKHSPERSPSPQKAASPQKSSSSPQRKPVSPQKGFSNPREVLGNAASAPSNEDGEEPEVDEVRSPSDASSPIRPIMRKSSLNFASLPAREPLASKKSLGGARMSRTSHLDFNRQSYFNRHTGGKSLGNAIRPESSHDDHEEMDVDDNLEEEKEDAAAHSKTYTQRLQDQISMLGKGQSIGPRPSKSLANPLPSQQTAPVLQSQPQMEPAPEPRKPSPKPKHSVPAPGAFPEDDDDEWIAPPSTAAAPDSPKTAQVQTDVSNAAQEMATKETIQSSEFVLPKSRRDSPNKAAVMREHTPKHGKSASVPALPTMEQLEAEMEDSPLKKTVSVSNPALATVAEDDFFISSPKSPARGFRDSPLKQVKNKLSSLLKSSKGLIASSAAISAEGKSSLLQSPSTTRLGYHPEPPVDSFQTADHVIYPDLSRQLSATSAPLSPTQSTRRGSAERERHEAKEREKQREKEMKEAKRMADQTEKLEKAREKEREKARVFSKEQQKIAAMEKQVAVQKEQENVSQVQTQPQQNFRTPRPAPKNALRSPTKATRTTPRKTKGQSEQDGKSTAGPSDEVDTEMTDATTTIPPPSIPRPTTASSMRVQGTKRPIKPTKEALAKSKQAPTRIRVNTTSSQQTQFHPSNSVLAATLHDTLGQQPGSARQANGKASQASLHEKPSLDSFKSSVSSTGRPKALKMAAKLREQEEREAQRRREARTEMDRKRAAQDEERRQEQQRRLDAERQKEEERKAAQRKAAIEKAKQTKAPPPAARSQPNGPPEYSIAEKGTLRPPSRLGSAMHQEGRLVNTVLSSTTKGPSKLPLQQDAGEESSRSQQQRALPSHPTKDAKRMRMSEEFDEDLDMVDSHNQRITKAPPVRPSGGFKKVSALAKIGRHRDANSMPQDPQPKSMYGNGYSNAPPPSASKDLFKATVTAQHQSQAKVARPLDMAQLSKGAIPFAPNPNQHAGPSHHYKTPSRPVGGAIPKSAKTVARSSPRFQNGEAIELPDIQTDDDSDADDGDIPMAPWANSPALQAALMAQEQVDPMQVFGPPAPLKMEEVFSKTKERWNKFRARTSSANWSGTDRLTEEDVRKDLAARDKMRREGGWSYELSREMS